MLMRTFVTSLLTTTLFLIASMQYSPVLAEGQDRAVLKKGDRAPFGGVLLTREALATLVTELQRKVDGLEAKLVAAEREREIRAEVESQKCDARVELQTSKLAACEGTRIKESKIYEQALEKSNAVPFWRSPTLMALVGAGLGVAACAASR